MPAPMSPPQRGVFRAEALSNERLCHEHYRLTLGLESFPPSRAGQFAQLQCRGEEVPAAAREIDWPAGGLPRATQDELVERVPLLRRPLSLADRRDRPGGGAEIDLIYRAIGAGTRWLAGVKAGDRVNVLGPLGNGFSILADRPMAALIGGGVGVPPMIYLARALTAAGRSAVAFCGARTGALLPLEVLDSPGPSAEGAPGPCVREFAAHCADAAVATDDGSLGFAGLVSEAFAMWLKMRDLGGRDLAVYACGPEPMMRAVADLCLARDIPCQLALERHMACGMGTCQSCVVKIRDPRKRDWSFKLCCTDGPVFDAKDVLW